MQAPHLTQPDKLTPLSRDRGALGRWLHGLLPCVGRLHGVLAHLPSAQIAPVAHARLDQSFPSLTVSVKSVYCRRFFVSVRRGDEYAAAI
jgi:hypothetical protein